VRRAAALWLVLLAAYATAVGLPASEGEDLAAPEARNLLVTQSIVRDGDLDLAGIDPRELDDDGDRGRVLREVDIDSRAKARPLRDEPRNLAEIGKELLHLALEPVDVFSGTHLSIVAAVGFLKVDLTP
jgi:hypothetical protein